ncbi:MFS transporter [Burkholderia vietnamiensis]|nr:MFS transporter [Burkholderia vietnamiensis]MDN7407981.1 MFS transporter [Burkholderia vietnamiensis]
MPALVIPFFRHLSDKVGRKPLLMACSALFVLTSYPLYTLLASKPSVAVVTGVILYFDLVLALLAAAAPSALVEIFPTKIRGQWLTAVYAIVIAIFGGFAPFIATSLISVTGNPIAPVFYVIFAALLSGIVIFKSPETAFGSLK